MHLIDGVKNKNQYEIIKTVQQYKRGAIVKFDALLAIPVRDRLPGLVEQLGVDTIHEILIIMVTEFCNFYNVIRPMSPDQIIDCAYEMIGTSSEDYLSLEDFTIFFDGAKKGNYGKIYDRLDQQTIFEMFEIYRQERHEKYHQIQEEKHTQFKGMGIKERITDDMTELKDLFHQANLEYFKSQNNDSK